MAERQHERATIAYLLSEVRTRENMPNVMNGCLLSSSICLDLVLRVVCFADASGRLPSMGEDLCVGSERHRWECGKSFLKYIGVYIPDVEKVSVFGREAARTHFA